ncbi:SUKH-4 family immunity protein [Streptomyces rubiginosohelvolus]|uniref:SUKH-4 family immunity protein n=1 Tax=Streptomyces rubiginosohelvolus TaxID=67362 RepID=UPI0033A66402
MPESDGAEVEAARRGERGWSMLFDVDHGALAAAVGDGNVHRLPTGTAERYGFTAETVDFLTEVGIPSAEDDEISFGLPAEFDDGYIWRRAVQESQGWKFPEGVEALIKIGNFPINAVVIDPVTGIVYQYTGASMEAIPVHADLSSLARTVGSFVEYVENYTRGDGEGDEDVEHARRKREVDAIHDAIRLVDPLPFAHEYSEWVEMFDNLEGGIYT